MATVAPLATFAALTPPTVLTTVTACEPVTSPNSGAVKLVALGATPTMAAAVKLVSPLPLPAKAPRKVPAETSPLASRLTSVLLALLAVAALARFAPLATFAAVTPPTVLTTVANCEPVTSPSSDAVKLVALGAVPTMVAAVRLLRAAPSPANLPTS